MIIMLNGHAGVGKDTVAEHLERAHGFRRYAIADGLREFLEKQNPALYTDPDATTVRLDRALRAYGGWSSLKRDASTGVRRLMESTGQAARDVLGEDVWLRALERRMHPHWQSAIARIVVSDVRYNNEAEWLECRAFSYLVRVERPGVGPVSDHVSAGILPYPDQTILNDGTVDDLKAKVDGLIWELR